MFSSLPNIWSSASHDSPRPLGLPGDRCNPASLLRVTFPAASPKHPTLLEPQAETRQVGRPLHLPELPANHRPNIKVSKLRPSPVARPASLEGNYVAKETRCQAKTYRILCITIKWRTHLVCFLPWIGVVHTQASSNFFVGAFPQLVNNLITH